MTRDTGHECNHGPASGLPEEAARFPPSPTDAPYGRIHRMSPPARALVALLLGVALHGVPAPAAEERAAEFRDVQGRTHTPLSQPGKKATALFFLLPDCPISNAYAPEIRRLCADYEPRQVAAFIVHADPDLSAEDAARHAREYGLPCPILRDPTHLSVKRTGVTVAPEVAVLGPNGQVLYRGRIDDLYVDFGKRRPAPTQRDLRSALDAVLQGQPVLTPTTRALGCYLPEPKK